jgi:hypothetical protein
MAIIEKTMEYHGKLYGRIGTHQYFDTSKTSEDWDRMERKINDLEAFISELERREMRIQQLEAVIRQRDKEILEANFDIADLKKLLAEMATRTQLIFPTDTESIKWFDEGTNWVKSDFFIRLYEHFGVTNQCDKCGRALQGGLFCPDCDL